MESRTFDAIISQTDNMSFNIECNGQYYTFKIEDGDVKAYDGDKELTLKYLGFKKEKDPMSPMGNYSSVLIVRAKFKHTEIQPYSDIRFKQVMLTSKRDQFFDRLQRFKTYKETTDGEAKAPEPTNSGGDAAGSSVSLRL